MLTYEDMQKALKLLGVEPEQYIFKLGGKTYCGPNFDDLACQGYRDFMEKFEEEIVDVKVSQETSSGRGNSVDGR